MYYGREAKWSILGSQRTGKSVFVCEGGLRDKYSTFYGHFNKLKQ